MRLLHGTDVQAMLWMVAYLGLLAVVLWSRFRSGRWRKIVLTEPTLEAV